MEHLDEFKGLDAEEAQLLSEYNNGEWVSTNPTAEQLAYYKASAAATLAMQKEMHVDLWLKTPDFSVLQSRAEQAGVSFQAYIANVLHQFAIGQPTS